MAQPDDEYVWFDDVRVVGDGFELQCIVNGKQVPLPVVILHPDCKLAKPGDVGRLGVPAVWAAERALIPR
ncbi:MAG TPA: hypothetical protein VNO26_11555 [Candidatus Limnocylindria bacterium]|nr:hypothetical protein [Candidatus Limnocylindria bacterium]